LTRQSLSDRRARVRLNQALGTALIPQKPIDSVMKHWSVVMHRRLAVVLLAVALTSGAIGIACAQAAGRRAGTGGVPNLDVTRSCRESSTPDCLAQEKIAREMLVKAWPDFKAQEKATCAGEAKEAGAPSYIEWLTCLQTNADARKFSATEKSATPAVKAGSDTGGKSSATHRPRRRHRHEK
jgi:hypothetical protein